MVLEYINQLATESVLLQLGEHNITDDKQNIVKICKRKYILNITQVINGIMTTPFLHYAKVLLFQRLV